MSSPRKIYIPSQVPKLGEAQREKVRKLRAARGIPAQVALGPVQAHIEWLRGIGFLDGAIGAAAGLPYTTVTNIRTGVHASVGIEQASRIMAVTHVPCEAQRRLMVPGLGVRRRLEGLSVLGYSLSVLGEHLGVSETRAHQLFRPYRVQGVVWFRVRDVYEQLSGVPGGSVRARRSAVARGLAAPLDWVGRDIDHPDHFPTPAEESDSADLVVVHRILRGDFQGEVGKPERKAVISHAAANGWSAARLVEAVGMSRSAADAALARARRKLREEGAA